MILIVNYKLLLDCLQGVVYWLFIRDQGREICVYFVWWKFLLIMVFVIENYLYLIYYYNLRNIVSIYEIMLEYISEGIK